MIHGLSITSLKADTSREYKVKASYIYNFIRFVNWPENAFNGDNAKPIRFCIFGKDQFKNYFDPVLNKDIKGHSLQLIRTSSLEYLENCHIVYVVKNHKNRLQSIFDQIKNKSVLTVSDINSFCSQGGMIGLVTRKGKIKVEINLEAAKAKGLEISSNLLEVSQIVSSQ